jgi:hypothetical protein
MERCNPAYFHSSRGMAAAGVQASCPILLLFSFFFFEVDVKHTHSHKTKTG